MSFIQYTPPASRPGVFLAVAAYRGLSGPFVASLYASQRADVGLCVLEGNCHVDDARNLLTRDFLASGCEQMVFLDADVCWSAPDLWRIIDSPADIVGGVYPKRSDSDEDWPVKPFPGPRYADARGLVKVAGLPTGFLKIRRRVLETLAASVPSFVDRADPGKPRIPIIFERTLNGDSRRGGDYEFSRKAIAAGFDCHVDPMLQLGHLGDKLWMGCLGHHWRKDVAIPEGLAAIRAGTAGAGTFLELFNVWGNTWAMDPEALYTAALLARQADGPVLDCGAGLSSLVMAAATDAPVVAMESSPVWASKIVSVAKQNGLRNLDVRLSDIADHNGLHWYADVPRDHEWRFVACDGPPRKTGRMGLFELLEPPCPILVDDMAHLAYRRQVQDWCAPRGRRLEIMDTAKPFGVVL